MKRVKGQNEFHALCIGQAVFHECQIAIFVMPVEFVADDRVTDVREVNPDLMFATGVRANLQQSKAPFRALETPLDPEFGGGLRAIGSNAVLDYDLAGFVLAERLVDNLVILRRPAVDDGPVFLGDFPRFPGLPEAAGELIGFCHQNQAAGFAVEPVDQVGDRVFAHMQPDATNQTGPGVGLGGMAHEPGRLVEHQQLIVFKNDI